jgi:hypothetical protein
LEKLRRILRLDEHVSDNTELQWAIRCREANQQIYDYIARQNCEELKHLLGNGIADPNSRTLDNQTALH